MYKKVFFQKVFILKHIRFKVGHTNKKTQLINKFKTASTYFIVVMDPRCEKVTSTLALIVKCIRKY